MKTLSIIQARMGSSRLPGKVVMKLSGKPLLQHIVENLQHSELTNQIIIATTDLPEDNPIRDFSNSLGIKCFSGSSNDVLKRYYECAQFYDGDIIVRINGDSPLVDPTLTDYAIQTCIKNNCDYVSNVLHLTYPLGYNSGEVIPFRILKHLNYSREDSASREHVTFHIRKEPENFKIQEICAPIKLRREKWRLTIDYKEDLELMKKIFQKLYKPNSPIEYSTLVNFLDKNPSLMKINEKYALNITKDNVNPIKDGLIK